MAFSPLPLGFVQGGYFQSGRVLKSYLGGTLTPTPMYTDYTGTTSTATILYDANGLPTVSGSVIVPHMDTTKGLIKYILYPDQASADANTGALEVFDNVQTTSSEVPNIVQTVEIQLGSAADGSNIFTLTNDYTPGNNSLRVERNGQVLIPGVAYDYQELSGTTVQLNYAPNANDRFVFRVGAQLTSAITTAAQVSYTPAGTGAQATNVRDKLREFVSVKDFGAVGDGTTSDVAAINAAITYALSGSALGAATEENYRTIYFPAGAYLIDSQITIPANAYLIFMGEGHLYNASILVQGFAGSMFVNTSGNNAVYHCLNLVFQGDKSTYVGSYHGIEVQSGADAVHLNLINCVFRDFGGWGVTLNTLFSGFMVNCIFAYNKAGGLRVSGGTGNVINVTTQNNLGAGIEILAQGTTGTMFIEGDLIDNNPAGLNLSNRALKLGGGYNRITATINTNSNNDKTPIETTAQGNEMLITGTGKGTATNWATLGASATYNYIGGNIGSSLTGDASAIATARRGINAGSSYYLTNGETLFSSGSLTPAGTDKGTRVGFDTAVNRGYVYPTEPGTANYPLDLIGSFICLKSPFASDQTAVASTLGTVVRRLEIQNQAGGTLGYIPIYNNIT